MDYRQAMIALYNSTPYQELSKYYMRKSTFDILGVSRTESVHSDFLAWLLRPNETHGCGVYAVKKLLQSIAKAKLDLGESNREGFLPDEYVDAFVTDACAIDAVDVHRERSISGSRGRARRPDLLLLISCTIGNKKKILPVIIENKVKSGEHDEQTLAYQEWALSNYANRRRYFQPLFVFLSPDRSCRLRRNRGRRCACGQYIRINYQTLVDNMIEPALERMASADARKLTEDYLRCLSFSDVTDERGKKGEIVMAITGKERVLLRQFWKSNSALLSAAMEALADDEDFSDSEREAFRRAGNAVAHKDYSRYRLNRGTEEYSKRGLVGAVVRAYLDANPRTTLVGFKRAFPDHLHSGGFSKLRNRVRDLARYFPGMRLADGKVIYVSNQWGVDNIEAFIECARGLHFDIEKC